MHGLSMSAKTRFHGLVCKSIGRDVHILPCIGPVGWSKREQLWALCHELFGI